jgi:ribosomal protein S18 acetylase RimI-like enzyme
MDTIHIRAYQSEDLPRVEALESRIQPYRPEDQPDVEAMFTRALQAEQADDPRWMAIPSVPPQPISREFAAFWVAEQGEKVDTPLAGIVGVEAFCAGKGMSARLKLAQDWQDRGNVAELCRLRVAPEVRGHGLGTRLCQTVVEWSRAQGYHTLVVNTTTPQIPALDLYRKMGFRDVALSFIGRYELIWLELPLYSTYEPG